MKIILPLLTLFFSVQVYASNLHTCVYGDFKINLLTNKEELISLTLLKNKTTIASCSLNVLSYDEGKEGVSSEELIRFSRQNCRLIYDKIAEKVIIVDSGFVKTSTKGNKSYVYVIKNEQPLACTFKKE